MAQSRTIFVSGGSRGIGADLVVAAARAGHDVAFTYVAHADAAQKTLDLAREAAPERTVRAYQLDVRDPSAVERVGDAVLADFEHVDVVVANAAITRVGLAFSLSNEDWKDVLDTNLSGAFYVSRQFLPSMLAQRWGRIVYMSSVAAYGMAGDVAYCATKAALIGLCKAMAKEYGRKGITSNALVLGLFATDMSNEASDRNWAFYREHSPVGRPGRTDEISAAVLYLVSDASGFVNGQTLGLTGGLDWYR
jgi:3-oxoacyl-[acyl-carrier protein] reductase